MSFEVPSNPNRFPPVPLAPTLEYFLIGPKQWGSQVCRGAYGQGCRFWIIITAKPLAILSVKLMAP